MNELIQRRLATYKAASEQEEENAIQEITQEIALWALAQSGFFEHTAFQGGTALRIFYGLNRFSEDLDFALKSPQSDFQLAGFLDKASALMEAYGYRITVSGKKTGSAAVQQNFLKEDSIGSIVTFDHVKKFRKSVKIKVEVDINPPAGAVIEPKLHDFPLDFMAALHNPASLLAGKSHALLCRPYIKGRDWYDFAWYAAQKTPLNFALLSAALDQAGPWTGRKITVDAQWYREHMQKKIKAIDWDAARKDVQRFLKPLEQETLRLWSIDFFLQKLAKIVG